MGEDQAHEQHNKVIKEDGGCVRLFTNDHDILEWAITSPFIMELHDIETLNPNKVDQNYHEDNETNEKEYIFDSSCNLVKLQKSVPRRSPRFGAPKQIGGGRKISK